ncbi:hypothetical protein ACIRG5_30070 [Lentzea sp. NPDC102401]|uniref:hypothetical protein n=1 Tax=Lentzea sp. NPDC102401 TaxID=3364128 RepID=UPI003819F67A
MDSAVLTALVRSPVLSTAQLRGIIMAVAAIRPQLLLELAGRSDLCDEQRKHMLREAPRYVVVDLLGAWSPDQDLVRAAVESHGAGPDLIVFCGARSWTELAAELAGQVDWSDVQQVASRWSHTLGEEMPVAVRLSLVDAVLTERDPRPELSSLSEWEKQRFFERLDQERAARASTAWSLLERHPELWVTLARDNERSMQIRRILLGGPDELSDEVLLACLPEVLSVQLRGKSYLTRARLHQAALYVRRWPQLRHLAADELHALVREVVDDGWTAGARHGGADWRAIEALAELSDDSKLLEQAVEAIRNTEPPSYRTQNRNYIEEWLDDRAKAVVALVMSPHVPGSSLITLVPILDERALETVCLHSEGDLQSACEEALSELRQVAESKRPRLIEVPSDDELRGHDDPVAVLHTHLRNLKGRAAQRDLTIEGLLRSCFVTPEILQCLPAPDVLESAEHAELVAEMLAAECGDDYARWSSLQSRCDPPPARTTTFGKWLDQLSEAGGR